MKIVMIAFGMMTLHNALYAMESERELNNALWQEAQKHPRELNLKQIEELLKQGADANLKPGKESLLMLAVNQKNCAFARLLIKFGANVNAQEDRFGSTPLMWAVSSEDPAMCKLLLAHGAHIGDVNDIGETALIRAKQRHNQEIIQLITQHYSSCRLRQ